VLLNLVNVNQKIFADSRVIAQDIDLITDTEYQKGGGENLIWN